MSRSSSLLIAVSALFLMSDLRALPKSPNQQNSHQRSRCSISLDKQNSAIEQIKESYVVTVQTALNGMYSITLDLRSDSSAEVYREEWDWAKGERIIANRRRLNPKQAFKIVKALHRLNPSSTKVWKSWDSGKPIRDASTDSGDDQRKVKRTNHLKLSPEIADSRETMIEHVVDGMSKIYVDEKSQFAVTHEIERILNAALVSEQGATIVGAS